VRIEVFTDPKEAAAAAAAAVGLAVEARPELVLGLPTGRTATHFYDELAVMASTERIDLSRVTTFNLDEFAGLGEDHPASYRAYMERHFFRRVPIDARRIHFLDGAAPDVDRECERYDAAIEAAGGIEVQVLGLGANGHIGFNEPGEWLLAGSHRVTLKEETRRANAHLFGGDYDRVPREALSIGMGPIMRARSILLMAHGRSKAPAVERMVNGPLTTRLPASFLQIHPNVRLMLDEAAAALLAGGRAGAAGTAAAKRRTSTRG
jgi:glucosamine-6-phosphate deaminase